MLYFGIVLIICMVGCLLKKYDHKYFLTISFIILFLMAAFRQPLLWGDLVGYERKHKILFSFSNFRELASKYLPDSKDIGYYIVEWFSTRMRIPFPIWLAIIAAFFLFITIRMIYRKSYYPLISILLFLALGFYSFSMSGLRQTIAIAITVLAYEQLDKNNIIKFVVLTCIAFLFHRTAIIFLILLALKNVRLGKYHIIISVAGLLGFFVYKQQLRTFFNTYLFTENYSAYSTSTTSLNYTRFFILIVIFMFCLLYYKTMKPKTKTIGNIQNNYLILYNAMFLSVIFQLYASFVAELFRISMYFSIYSIILVPLALKNEKCDGRRRVIGLLMISILIIYIFISGGLGVAYRTIWS